MKTTNGQLTKIKNRAPTRAAYILGIGTATPPSSLSQDDFHDRLCARGFESKKQRYLNRILQDSGISNRNLILELSHQGTILKDGVTFEGASTRERNDVFAEKVGPLVAESTRTSLRAAGINAHEITHLIGVTCTGFTNPGFDLSLIQEVGLSPTVHRYTLGFMGCYAAFPALELAQSITASDPKAKVLCICAELCSLHFRPEGTFDDLLASTLFADGVAAVVVGSTPTGHTTTPRIDSAHSAIIPEGDKDMAWSIGDEGFTLVLSPYVSRIVTSNLEELLDPTLLNPEATSEHWIIHPGGKSILDRAQDRLKLKDHQIEDSRATLNSYGNMSSATVLFALQRLLRSPRLTPTQTITMLGIGPGLTLKTLLLTT